MPKKKSSQLKKNNGRPTKYRSEYCGDLIAHMKVGGSIESFGAYLGEKYGESAAVGRATIYNWADTNSEFLDTLEVGRSYGLRFYENIAVSGMTGNIKRVVNETPIIVDGKPVVGQDGKMVTKKEYEPATFNGSVLGMIMKNRFGWRDKVEHSGEIKSSTSVGDALTKILNDPKLAAAAKSIAEKLVEDDE